MHPCEENQDGCRELLTLPRIVGPMELALHSTDHLLINESANEHQIKYRISTTLTNTTLTHIIIYTGLFVISEVYLYVQIQNMFLFCFVYLFVSFLFFLEREFLSEARVYLMVFIMLFQIIGL